VGWILIASTLPACWAASWRNEFERMADDADNEPIADDLDSLRPRQRAFIAHYIEMKNATKAAIAAGYEWKRAQAAGYRLANHPVIRREVQKAEMRLSATVEVTAERVIAEMARMAFYDTAELADGYIIDEGAGVLRGLRGPEDIPKLPRDLRSAIAGWGYDRNNNFTVKLADRAKALDQLGRHLALFNDKLDIQVDETLAARLQRAKERIKPKGGE
jgi:phage terminase small subunit